MLAVSCLKGYFLVDLKMVTFLSLLRRVNILSGKKWLNINLSFVLGVKEILNYLKNTTWLKLH